MKSEPDVYSIHDLAAEPGQTDYWDGIRNYQVRNFIRDDMKAGDLAFFYHSRCKVPGIVGTMRIVREAYPDHTAFDETEKYFDPKSDPDNPRWLMFDVRLDTIFPDIISLTELKQHEPLAEMRVVQKGNRLSITPVTKQQWNYIVSLSTGD
ncbi:MAG: EVE domain-containing protein [Acidiferrobacterales bacterium]|nr:EVE domain-containing protein [Acidiferrobacterales bacterium]